MTAAESFPDIGMLFPSTSFDEVLFLIRPLSTFVKYGYSVESNSSAFVTIPHLLKNSLRARQLISLFFNRHPDRFSKGFKDRLDLVVLVGPFGFDIQVAL